MVKFLRPMEDLEMHSGFVHRFGRRREKREAMFKGGGGGGGPKPGASWSESSGSEGMTVPGGVVGGGGEGRGFACSSQGSISVIGQRRSMEDAVRVVPGAVTVEGSETYDVFAVYDGHGGAGVSRMCEERLHVLLAEEVERWGRTSGAWRLEDWEGVMAASFARMDEEVEDDGGGGAQTEENVRPVKTEGSTAVVVLVGRKEIVVANCGDSRAVLCRGGVDVPLSCDHKADRPDEMERVEAAGGRVINWNGSRVLGVLAISRSIGDHYLRPYVISEPEVTTTNRTEGDEFLIIASDGLWDVVSNKFACELVRRCLNRQIRRRSSDGVRGSCAADAAAMLADMAIARGSTDNISVIVVELG